MPQRAIKNVQFFVLEAVRSCAMANLELCRLCLNYTPVHYSLLKEEFREMLNALTAIQVAETNETGTEVCVKCLLNLKLAHRIQRKFLQADERLRMGFFKQEPILDGMVKVELDDDSVKVELDEDSSDSCITRLLYKCEQCSLTFQAKGSYEKHMAKKHPESQREPPKKSYKCKFCEVEFSKKSELRTHKHDIVPCPVCKKKLRYPGLKKHVREQHERGNESEICDLCGGQYKFLHKHKLRQHNNSRLNFKCEECGKSYMNRKNWVYHKQRYHTGDAPQHVCETCGKIFYSRAALSKHMEGRHDKSKSHTCGVCQKNFSSEFSLKAHLRQHTNEMPYTCEVCGQAFRHNVSLKAHKKAKHGFEEKEVVSCKVCGKGFASPLGLRVHERLHMV